MGQFVMNASDNATGRAPSGGIWATCPLEDIILRGMGTYFFDDFHDIPTGKWTATQATAGTWATNSSGNPASLASSTAYTIPAPDQYVYGVALADSGSSTAAQGINVQLGGTEAGGFVPRIGTGLWYEARIAVSDAATGGEYFVGLASTSTAIISSSAVSSTLPHIGFGSTTDDNVMLFRADTTSATAETTTAGTLLDLEAVAATGRFHKLGFRVYDINVPGTGVVQYAEGFFDGVKIATKMSNLVIPIGVPLRPSFVCQSSGTVDPIMHVDWVRVAQTFYSGNT